MKNFNTKIFASVTAALMIAGTVVAASAAEYSYQNGRRTLAPDTVSENAGVERDTSAYAWNRGTEQNANREEAYAARPGECQRLSFPQVFHKPHRKAVFPRARARVRRTDEDDDKERVRN